MASTGSALLRLYQAATCSGFRQLAFNCSSYLLGPGKFYRIWLLNAQGEVLFPQQVRARQLALLVSPLDSLGSQVFLGMVQQQEKGFDDPMIFSVSVFTMVKALGQGCKFIL